MSRPESLTEKQRQFNAAMEKYNSGRAYVRFGLAVSVFNCGLQAVLLVLALRHTLGWLWQVAAFAGAYVLADFINGLVHLYMDGNDDYTSPAGPLVAAFHLHHKRPVYRIRNIFMVYFIETGSKVWLAGFLALAVLLAAVTDLPLAIVYMLAYTGILSSVAEVSHYLAHVENSRWPGYFRKLGLILDKRLHAKHHLNDNVQYTFLNGMTDPLINVLARRLYPGYKNFTDLHYQTYAGPQTENR